jgi:hypothetical protein
MSYRLAQYLYIALVFFGWVTVCDIFVHCIFKYVWTVFKALRKYSLDGVGLFSNVWICLFKSKQILDFGFWGM